MEPEELFDQWAESGRDQGMEEGHGQTAGPLLAAFDIRPGTRFLDLGCGNGWAARFAMDHGAKAAGLDAAPKMIERAKSLAPEGDFRVGDFAALPWDDDAFDLAWSMEALYYAKDPDAVLGELKRVLAPGGVFHMLIDYYQENTDTHTWPKDCGVRMELRSEPAWRDAFQAAGFTDVQSDRLKAEPGEGISDWKVEQGSLHVWGSA